MAVSKRLRFEILTRDGEACRKCGRRPPDVELQVDHVIPVTLGGSDDPTNLQTLCRDCNSGKSSVPADAPVVAEVSKTASAMAEALQIVAEQRATGREWARRLHGAFLDEWNSWTNWRGDTFDLPGDWRSNIDQLLKAGLQIDDLIELVDVAMSAKAKDTWKYFCGCCWRRLKQDVEKAAKMLEQPQTLSGNTATFHTDWTFEDIQQMWTEAVEEASQCEHPPTVECPHPEKSAGLGHCGDPVCMIRSATELYLQAIDVQCYDAKRTIHADRIDDAAEALEVALDG